MPDLANADLVSDPGRAGARAHLRAMGLAEKDWARPLVGIATTWTGTMPCNLGQRRLAASVQRSLYGTLAVQNPGLRDRGVKAASYVVLTETAMPGILAEVSFVSSPTDEQKLRSDGYREQIAEALYRGIARYAAAPRGVKVLSAASSRSPGADCRPMTFSDALEPTSMMVENAMVSANCL